MKHKAQDELYTLLCKAHTNHEECEANRCTKDETCLSCDYKKAYDKLQDLINCQLTVEEIEMLQDALLVIKHYRKSKYHDIKHKLMKQKEMWVSENE